jgi:heat shock protein HslJ
MLKFEPVIRIWRACGPVGVVALWFTIVLLPASSVLPGSMLSARGELDGVVGQRRATRALEALVSERQGGGERLAGTSWVLQEIEGRDVLETPRAMLTFEGNEKIAGDGGCNRFFGPVKIDGSAITFGPLGATRRACGEPIDSQELAFLGALAKAAAFSLERGALVIVAADETPLLRLGRAD